MKKIHRIAILPVFILLLFTTDSFSQNCSVSEATIFPGELMFVSYQADADATASQRFSLVCMKNSVAVR